MTNYQMTCVLTVAVLLGCAPGEIDDEGETEDATETDSSAPPDQTCSSPTTIELNPSGRTWSTCVEWGAWAETTTAEKIAQRVADDELEETDSPPGATCYTLGVDMTVCTVEVGPLLLLGRSVAQLELVLDEGPCVDLYGPWDYEGWDGVACFGVFETSAVAVEIY